MRNIITVGIGDYYKRILEPTLIKMESDGMIKHIATVDVKPTPIDKEGVEHLIRTEDPLSKILEKYRKDDPMVILAHSNHMHVPDTIDLSTNGFKVALEKPYALHTDALLTMLNHSDINNVFLLEYYLMMKAAPLLWGYGSIKKDSFYHNLLQPQAGLGKYASSVKDFHGVLRGIVGDIVSISADVLEGEGEVGRLDHRGVATIDIRAGGGMIQDMLIHAVAPVLAFAEEIGMIKSYIPMVAVSHEYASMAESQYKLKTKHIGESYVDVSARTDKNIPVHLRVGKYVYGDRNVRGILINGTKKSVFLDMNTCTLFIDNEPILQILKDEYKYYAVIRAALESFAGKPLFNFNSNTVSFKSQELVLAIQDEVYRTKIPAYYHSGIVPEKIFGDKK